MGRGIEGRGQALVLLALAFAGMLALLALAIDGGNAYAQRRRAQNAADAAALSATRRLYEIQRQGGSEADLLLALRQAIDAHGTFNVDGQPNRFEAEYVDETGNPIAPLGAGTIPENAQGVRVTIINRFDAFFAGVFGFDPMEVRTLATAVYHLTPACPFALFAENDLRAEFGRLDVQAGGVHAGGDLTLQWTGVIQGPCEYGESANINFWVRCQGGRIQAPYQPLPALYAVSDFAPGGPLWSAYPGRRYCIRPQDPSQPIVLDAHPAGARDPLPDQCITAQRVRLRDGLYYLEGNVQVIRSQGGGQIRADVTLAALGSLILSDLNRYDLRSAFNDPQRGAPLLVAGQAITITTPSFEWQGLILANGGTVTLSTVIQARSDRGAIYGRALHLNGGILDLTFDPTVCPVGIARVELLR
ncbi:MAG TPA: pilus assembly protein TadG-related protein [Thermoflexus sp.]|nr:pilus assembly protein TadG-related protein [Thermoflexus sp.]